LNAGRAGGGSNNKEAKKKKRTSAEKSRGPSDDYTDEEPDKARILKKWWC